MPLTAIGTGSLDFHDTHVYVRTSSWMVSNVDKRYVDITNFLASNLSNQEEPVPYFNY
jgi:hypothetical protein